MLLNKKGQSKCLSYFITFFILPKLSGHDFMPLFHICRYKKGKWIAHRGYTHSIRKQLEIQDMISQSNCWIFTFAVEGRFDFSLSENCIPLPWEISSFTTPWLYLSFIKDTCLLYFLIKRFYIIFTNAVWITLSLLKYETEIAN